RLVDRAGGSAGRIARLDMRVARVEGPDLAQGPPAFVAVARLPQVGLGAGVEASTGVERAGKLARKRLVGHEPVVARQPDRVFVQTLRIEITAFEPRDLSADQRLPVGEVLWTVLGPERDPLVVRGHRAQVLVALLRGRTVAGSRSGECRVEVVL